MKFITGNETEPVTRTRVTWMLVVEPASGELTSRSRGPWDHVQAQLREDLADPQLAGKRLGIIRTDTIEIEHPVQWQEQGTGPGAGLTAADVDTLVITAAELWDPDGAGADEALSGRQREVLAKARAIHDREYAGYDHSQEA